MKILAAAVAALVAMAELVLRKLTRASKAQGRAEAERDVLEVDHEKQEAAAKIAARPLEHGQALRDRLRARNRRP
jgi:hypothetical protein